MEAGVVSGRVGVRGVEECRRGKGWERTGRTEEWARDGVA